MRVVRRTCIAAFYTWQALQAQKTQRKLADSVLARRRIKILMRATYHLWLGSASQERRQRVWLQKPLSSMRNRSFGFAFDMWRKTFHSTKQRRARLLKAETMWVQLGRGLLLNALDAWEEYVIQKSVASQYQDALEDHTAKTLQAQAALQQHAKAFQLTEARRKHTAFQRAQTLMGKSVRAISARDLIAWCHVAVVLCRKRKVLRNALTALTY